MLIQAIPELSFPGGTLTGYEVIDQSIYEEPECGAIVLSCAKNIKYKASYPLTVSLTRGYQEYIKSCCLALIDKL